MLGVKISDVVLPDNAVELPGVLGPSAVAGPGVSVRNALTGPGVYVTNALTITGWPVIACGVVLAVAGGATASAFLGAPNRFGAPAWAIPAVGLLCGAIGLYITINGLSGLRHQRTNDARAKEMPDQPWLWDHEWREDGIGGDTGGEIAKAFGFALLAVLSLVPFHWAFFAVKEIPWVFGFGLVIGDVVVVAVTAHAVRLVQMRRRYGASWLHFHRFPFRTGGRLEATLDATGGKSDLAALNATLRCVQERYEMRGLNTHDKEFQVVRYALWSASARVDRSSKGTFDFKFEIPADVPDSALSQQPSRYWELIVASGEVPGVDYEARFLVPIYHGR
jgi:hypothetical protein